MILTAFAPNESANDALASFALLFQPWRWRKGIALIKVKKSLASIFKTKYDNVYLFLTARAALFHYLQNLNLPKNTQVAVQGFTCEAVVLPVLANNLQPLYIDIDEKTYSMDPDSLRKRITDNTKVIILQHSFGIPPNREEILAIAKEHNAVVIEDMAHGFYRKAFASDKKLTTKLLSFGRSKVLSSVFGGAIITADKKVGKELETVEKKFTKPSRWFIFKTLLYKPLAQIIKATHGIGLGKVLHVVFQRLGLLVLETTKKEKKGEYDSHFDKVFPNALAVLLLHQLKKFRNIEKLRASNTKFYHDFFSVTRDTHALTFPKQAPLSRYPLRLTDKKKVVEKLRKQGILVGEWYTQPVDPKQVPLPKVKYHRGDCPVAEKTCQEVINLPTYIAKKDAKRIIAEFKNGLS